MQLNLTITRQKYILLKNRKELQTKIGCGIYVHYLIFGFYSYNHTTFS